jgi:hypothetical protein
MHIIALVGIYGVEIIMSVLHKISFGYLESVLTPAISFEAIFITLKIISTLLQKVLFILSLLFLFDTGKCVRSCVLAAKMIVLNLPIFILVCIVQSCAIALLFYGTLLLFFLPWIAQTQQTIQLVHHFFGYMLMPVSFCIISTIYIKRLYEQYDMYCKKS